MAEQKHDNEGSIPEPFRAIVAVHPAGDAFAVAVGTDLRVADFKSGSVHQLIHHHPSPTNGNSSASAIITHCLAFSPCGRFLSSGGSDKLVRVWQLPNWILRKTVKLPKKVSAITFSTDGEFVFAADRFGEVYTICTKCDDSKDPAGTLLGHYCSQITCMAINRDGRLIATTDRDARTRISVLPKDPMTAGAHEIVSFCFGHTEFATCASFISQGDSEVLLTGAGDESIRMWRINDGQEIAQLYLPSEGQKRAVLSMQPSADGRHLVVVLDGTPAVAVVRVDVAAGTLQDGGRHTLPSLPLCTDVTLDHAGKFWLVGGPLSERTMAVVVQSAVVNEQGALMKCESTEVDKLREALEGCDGVDMEAIVSPRSFLPPYLHKRAGHGQKGE